MLAGVPLRVVSAAGVCGGVLTLVAAALYMKHPRLPRRHFRRAGNSVGCPLRLGRASRPGCVLHDETSVEASGLRRLRERNADGRRTRHFLDRHPLACCQFALRLRCHERTPHGRRGLSITIQKDETARRQASRRPGRWPLGKRVKSGRPRQASVVCSMGAASSVAA